MWSSQWTHDDLTPISVVTDGHRPSVQEWTSWTRLTAGYAVGGVEGTTPAAMAVTITWRFNGVARVKNIVVVTCMQPPRVMNRCGAGDKLAGGVGKEEPVICLRLLRPTLNEINWRHYGQLKRRALARVSQRSFRRRLPESSGRWVRGQRRRRVHGRHLGVQEFDERAWTHVCVSLSAWTKDVSCIIRIVTND